MGLLNDAFQFLKRRWKERYGNEKDVPKDAEERVRIETSSPNPTEIEKFKLFLANEESERAAKALKEEMRLAKRRAKEKKRARKTRLKWQRWLSEYQLRIAIPDILQDITQDISQDILQEGAQDLASGMAGPWAPAMPEATTESEGLEPRPPARDQKGNVSKDALAAPEGLGAYKKISSGKRRRRRRRKAWKAAKKAQENKSQ
jgi:hypothetical protein